MLAIVQARLSSKRLPRKVLKKIGRYTVLEHVINQLRIAFPSKNIIVATSKSKQDLAICNLCKKIKIKFFRGDLKNVTKRYDECLNYYRTPSFLRVCADSPLIDPALIKKCQKIFNSKKPDFLTNILPRSFPKGQSIEIFNTNFFKKNIKKIKKGFDKEHVTTYFYSNKKKFFYINVKNKINFSKVNMCVDTHEDLSLLKKNIFKIKNKKKIKNWLQLVPYFSK